MLSQLLFSSSRLCVPMHIKCVQLGCHHATKKLTWYVANLQAAAGFVGHFGIHHHHSIAVNQQLSAAAFRQWIRALCAITRYRLGGVCGRHSLLQYHPVQAQTSTVARYPATNPCHFKIGGQRPVPDQSRFENQQRILQTIGNHIGPTQFGRTGFVANFVSIGVWAWIIGDTRLF